MTTDVIIMVFGRKLNSRFAPAVYAKLRIRVAVDSTLPSQQSAKN